MRAEREYCEALRGAETRRPNATRAEGSACWGGMGADGPHEKGEDATTLLAAVGRARRCLPATHRALLEQIGVQEVAIEDWPDGVKNCYRTVRETAPADADLDGAAAVWLHGLRLVAFNAPLVRRLTVGLDSRAYDEAVAAIAWHEYGHALSLTRSTDDQRRRGVHLLDLLPHGLRRAIDHPGAYRSGDVFDEVIASVYTVLVGRVRTDGYGRPEYLPAEVYQAFTEVIPWPPSR
jgi:hypothetical protein